MVAQCVFAEQLVQSTRSCVSLEATLWPWEFTEWVAREILCACLVCPVPHTNLTVGLNEVCSIPDSGLLKRHVNQVDLMG